MSNETQKNIPFDVERLGKLQKIRQTVLMELDMFNHVMEEEFGKGWGTMNVTFDPPIQVVYSPRQGDGIGGGYPMVMHYNLLAPQDMKYNSFATREFVMEEWNSLTPLQEIFTEMKAGKVCYLIFSFIFLFIRNDNNNNVMDTDLVGLGGIFYM
jgi:hypothetical protein